MGLTRYFSRPRLLPGVPVPFVVSSFPLQLLCISERLQAQVDKDERAAGSPTMAQRESLNTLLQHYKHRGVQPATRGKIKNAPKPLELPSIQQQGTIASKAKSYLEKFPMSTPLNQYLHTRNSRSPYYAKPGRKKRVTSPKARDKTSSAAGSRSAYIGENELGALLDRFLTKDTPTMEALLKQQGGVSPRVGPPLPADSQLDKPKQSLATTLPALPSRPQDAGQEGGEGTGDAVSLPSLQRPSKDAKQPPAGMPPASPPADAEEEDPNEGKATLGEKWKPGDRVVFTPPDKKLPQERGKLAKWVMPGVWAVAFDGKEGTTECKVAHLERDLAWYEEQKKKAQDSEMKQKELKIRDDSNGTHREDYDYAQAIEDEHVASNGAFESDLADDVQLLNVNEFIQEARDTSDTLMFPTPKNSCVIFKVQHKLSGKYTPENPPEYYSKIDEGDLKEFKRLSQWETVPSLYPKYIEIKPAVPRWVPSTYRLKEVTEDIQAAVSLNISPPDVVEVSTNRYPPSLVKDTIEDDDESVYTGDALFMHPRPSQVVLDEEEIDHLSRWAKDIDDLHRRSLEEMSAQNSSKNFRLLQPKLYFDRQMTGPTSGTTKAISAAEREQDEKQALVPFEQSAQDSVLPAPANSAMGMAQALVPAGGQAGGGQVAAAGGGAAGAQAFGAQAAGAPAGGVGQMNALIANQMAFFNSVLQMQTAMTQNLAKGGGSVAGAAPMAAGAGSQALVAAGPGRGADINDEEDRLENQEAERDMFEEAKIKELFTKARNNRSREVEEAFSLGQSPDVTDKFGNTVLHIACQNGHKRMIKVCLRWGANLNGQNNEGQTALHFLFNYHYQELGAYLISKGADDTICNHFGYNCYEQLRPDNKEEAMRLLRKHKQKLEKESKANVAKQIEGKRAQVQGGAAGGGNWFKKMDATKLIADK